MKKSLLSDNQLLQQLKAGKPEAFEQIYKGYVNDLLAYASHRLSSLEEARDMVQDIFLNFYERRDQIEITVSIKAYLFSALKYKIIDHIRKNSHTAYYSNLIHTLSVKSDDNLLNKLIYKDLNEIVDREIQSLPSRIRETFLLSRKRHLSISEIASQMNVSEQTVKNQLTTAMKRLRPILEKVMLLFFLLIPFS